MINQGENMIIKITTKWSMNYNIFVQNLVNFGQKNISSKIRKKKIVRKNQQRVLAFNA
jgi:hypothetical protein